MRAQPPPSGGVAMKPPLSRDAEGRSRWHRWHRPAGVRSLPEGEPRHQPQTVGLELAERPGRRRRVATVIAVIEELTQDYLQAVDQALPGYVRGLQLGRKRLGQLCARDVQQFL